MWRFCLLMVACVPWTDVDLDGDGYGPDDCDDVDPLRFPGAPDTVGDGVDQDCDGVDGQDVDGDGWAGEASGGLDCDDRSVTVFPGADEQCNGLDDNCDGVFPADEADADQDGVRRCDGDCDDGTAGIGPQVVEICGEDVDCDGVAASCTERFEAGVWVGSAPAGDFGWSVAGTDVDEDGRLDLLVGAPGSHEVHVFTGPVLSAVGGPAAQVWQATVGDELGTAVATGPAGVALGAPGDDAGGLDAGAVWVRAAGVAMGPLADTSMKWVGESSGDRAGTSVIAAGDPDGDGDLDWLIGAEQAGVGGVVYLVDASVASDTSLSGASVRFEAAFPGQMAGHALASGDVNGDGLTDVWIGAPGEGAGAAYLVLGRTGTPGSVRSLEDSDAVVVGLAPGDRLGWSVAVADVNGDGFDDTWLGAPGAGGGKGSAYLMLGAASGVSADLLQAEAVWQGAASGAGVGERVGFADGLVASGDGEVQGLQRPGVVWWSDAVPPSLGLQVLGAPLASGVDARDRFGAALAVGDFNADGAQDLVVGAPWAGASGQGPGEVRLIVGRTP